MLTLAVMLLEHARDRARALRADDERELGATALEWAIIAAIVVVAASVIGGVIFRIVQTKGTSLEKCANQPVGSACTG
jgi:Flp pilus assembly pilin Flp